MSATQELTDKLQNELGGVVQRELTNQIGAVIPGGISKITGMIDTLQNVPNILTLAKSNLTAAVVNQVNTQMQAIQPNTQSGGSRKIRRKRRRSRSRKM